MEAVTRSQYKRIFHKIFEDELITATGMGHHARMRICFFLGGARISCLLLLTHTYTPTRRGRPSAGRPALCRAERGLHLLSRKPPSLSLPHTVTQ